MIGHIKAHKSKLLLVSVTMFIAAAWLIAAQRAEARKVTYVIPAGTGQKLETGHAGVNFPDEIIMTIGVIDTIVIENQDDVIHTFGPFVVGPQSTLTKRFETPQVVEGACTFHQEQHMRLVVNAPPWDIFD